MLVVSIMMLAEPKPLRVVVLGDDPMMANNEAEGGVGYAAFLQPLFDAAVTVDVQVSESLLPTDPAALLEPARKGDIALICKMPVAEEAEEKTQSDVYLDQLLAIQQAAKKKGVKVVWMTPVAPRYFTAEGEQIHRRGIYPDVVRKLCKRDVLPIIDVEQLTFDWLTGLGQEGSAAAYLPVLPAIPEAADKAAREGNLLTEHGAKQVAMLIGDALHKDKKHLLNKRVRPSEDAPVSAPTTPAPAEEKPAEELVVSE